VIGSHLEIDTLKTQNQQLSLATMLCRSTSQAKYDFILIKSKYMVAVYFFIRNSNYWVKDGCA